MTTRASGRPSPLRLSFLPLINPFRRPSNFAGIYHVKCCPLLIRPQLADQLRELMAILTFFTVFRTFQYLSLSEFRLVESLTNTIVLTHKRYFRFTIT